MVSFIFRKLHSVHVLYPDNSKPSVGHRNHILWDPSRAVSGTGTGHQEEASPVLQREDGA